MLDYNQKTLIIYSTFTSLDKEAEFEKFDQHFSLLEKAKVVEGFYKGRSELSIVTEFKEDFQVIDILTNLNQESVLILEPHKHGLYKAYLTVLNDRDGQFPLTKEEFIGFFRCVNKETALKQNNYTKDGNNYYICTESDSTIN